MSRVHPPGTGHLFFDEDDIVEGASTPVVPPTPSVTSGGGNFSWITHVDNYIRTVLPAASGTNIAYVQSTPVTRKWHSASTVAEDITMDMGAAVGVNVISLVNHNLSASASISVFAGTTTAYSNFSDTIDWRDLLAWKKLAAVQSYRYWKITLSDNGNDDGFLSMGYLVVGQLTIPNLNFRNGWISTPQFFNQELMSHYEVPNIIGMSRKQRLKFAFGPATYTEMTPLRSMYDQVKRNRYPLLLIPDNMGDDAYFGRLQGMFDERIDLYRQVDIEFEEDGYGHRQ